MYQILLVEDTEEVQDLIIFTLKDICDICIASSFDRAMELVQRRPFELILLDVGLPDGNGFQLCSNLQSDDNLRDIPIFFLTGQTKIDDIVMGYKLGADDYITKPFEPRIFKAKIEAKLSKIMSYKSDWIDKGFIKLNPIVQKSMLIWKNGDVTDIDLTPIEFRLLLTFFRNEEKILSRNQLIDNVWNEETHITDRVVDMHISALRKKLAFAGKCIRTVYGSGYCFTLAPHITGLSA